MPKHWLIIGNVRQLCLVKKIITEKRRRKMRDSSTFQKIPVKKKPQSKNVRKQWKVARKLQRSYKFKLQNQRFERGYM